MLNIKKIRIIILLSLSFFIPMTVYAEDCNQKNIQIKSIELVTKSDTVKEISDVALMNNKVNLNLEMHEIGEFAEYKLKVKNLSQENYFFDENSVDNPSKYMQYQIYSTDHSNEIKPGKEKDIYLKIIYENEMEKTEFRSGKHEEKNHTIMNLSTRNHFIENITNPKTSQSKIFMILLAITMIGLLSQKKKKKLFLFLLSLFLIPITTYAICNYKLEIDSTIIINKIISNHCSFDGDLVQGAEYVNGQYTYRYMQERDSTHQWINMSNEGWGVILTDKESTDDVTTPLCSYINDKPVVSMQYMFYETQTHNIDLISFDTSNVINMFRMFSGAVNIEKYDLSSFNTENVVNMDYMFQNNSSLKSIDLRGFNTKSLTSAISLFLLNSNLESVNMDNWDFSNSSNGTNILGGVFAENTSLKTVSLKNWIIPQNFMHALSRTFAGYYSPIETVDVTGWDLSNTKSIQGFFADSKFLKEIIGLETWDTSNVEDMIQLFYNCEKLQKLDLSSFDFSNVIVSDQILANTVNLKEIITPKKYSESNIINLYGIFYDSEDIRYTELKDGDKTKESIIIKEDEFAMLDKGEVVNIKLKKLAGIPYPYKYSSENTISSIRRSYNKPDLSLMGENNIISSDTSATPVYAWVDNYTIYYYSDSQKIYTNEDSSGLFCYFYKLHSIELNGFDTSKTENMESMFYYTASDSDYNVSISISNFDTSSVKNMKYMFAHYGEKSNSINTSIFKNLNVENVEDMTEMMCGMGEYANEINLDLSNWKFGKDTKVTRMFNCFARMAKSVNVDLSNWDLNGVTDATEMLYDFAMDTKNLKIDLSNWNTSTITNMTGMFDHFGQYAINFSMDLSTWDVSNVENMNRLFQDAFEESRGNILINLSNWNTSKVKNMAHMFMDTASRASGLTMVGLDHFDTKNVENMNYMFAYTGNMASNINDIGTLEVYASSMVCMFSASKNIQVVLNIHNPVTTYTRAFENSATLIGSSITVNYTNDITNVDDIIATKSNDSHVVKGNLIP